MSWEKALGDVIDIRRTALVVIHDAWTGYNIASPITAGYQLLRGPRGNLSGKGRFSTSLAGERVIDISVPAAATKLFLETIADAPIQPGAYQPMLMSTDDYPQIEIALHVGPHQSGSGIALLFTESQGEFHAPWGACIGGKLWTLPDETIGRALTKLHGPLKRATLERMVNEPTRSSNRAPRETPGRRVARRIRG